jgi:hypothetical protein
MRRIKEGVRIVSPDDRHRTSVWDVIRLVFVLLRCKSRKSQRIGQIIFNASRLYGRDSFYAENRELLAQLDTYDCMEEIAVEIARRRADPATAEPK